MVHLRVTHRRATERDGAGSELVSTGREWCRLTRHRTIHFSIALYTVQ